MARLEGLNPTGRFSNRADDYVRYRPGYPRECYAWLADQGVGPDTTIADVGAGTGIFARGLLSLADRVICVEPNDEMRTRADRLLGDVAGYQSQRGTAEATGLEKPSIDLITAAQAFHWFDVLPSLAEFRRILRPNGRVALVWNRRLDTTPFMKAYEELLQKRAPDYSRVDHRNLPRSELEACFDSCRYVRFANRQAFDWPGLEGRAASSSYVPAPGVDGHDEFFRHLRDLFSVFSEKGHVTFEYTTELYFGPLARDEKE